MNIAIRLATLSLFGFVVLPVVADDTKTQDKKPTEKKTEMVAAGTLSGKILHVNESKHSLKIRVDIKEINQGEAQAIANLQNEIARISATERNPVNRANGIQNRLNDISRRQNNLYKTVHKDIEVTPSDEVKVRMANLPIKYDDKGKPVKYTNEEKKAAKGDDPKAIGYKAEFSDLRNDQIVSLVMMKKKGTPVLPKPEPGKEVDKSDIAVILAEYEPKVTTIVIVSDAVPK